MHSPARAARAATCDHGDFEERARQTLLSLHYLVTLGKDVAGLESRKTRVRRSSDGAMVDGGPKPTGNRGANDCGERSLVERPNQMVSIHPDMADAPTHRSPGNHGSLSLKAQKPARPMNPPRPSETDPSRADLRGLSRY